MTRSRQIRNAVFCSSLMTLLAGACGGGVADQPDAEVQATGSSVSVTLANYVVEADPDSVAAGKVTFEVSNESGGHNLFVLRTDLGAEEIPQHRTTLRPGVKALKPDLEAPGLEILGSIPPIQAGQTNSLTLDLQPGHYVLICDLIDVKEVGEKTKTHSHYAQGMRTDFSVR